MADWWHTAEKNGAVEGYFAKTKSFSHSLLGRHECNKQNGFSEPAITVCVHKIFFIGRPLGIVTSSDLCLEIYNFTYYLGYEFNLRKIVIVELLKMLGHKK